MALRANTRAALLMSLSMTGFAVNDGFMKLAFQTLPVAQSVVLRGLVAVVLLTLIAWRTGALAFRPQGREWWPILCRVLGEIGAAATFLTALSRLPIADATAVLQAAPLVVTVAAALFLAEPVGWRRWSAIGVGFAGMLLIVRPFTAGFDPFALLAVVTVLFIVMRDITTRFMSPRTPTIYASTLSAYATTAAFAMAIPITGWQPVTPAALGFTTVAAGFVIIAYVGGVAAMRSGDVSAVAPFRYTVLVAAIIVGYLFFGDLPDRLTFLGAAIVVAAGLYTLWREHVVGGREPAARTSQRPFAPRAPNGRRR